MAELRIYKWCLYKTWYSKYSLEALHSNNKKQSIQMEHNRIKNPNWQQAASCLFTSVEEDLNLEGPRTNPASGQSGTWTRYRRISILTRCARHSAKLPSKIVGQVAQSLWSSVQLWIK